MKNEFDNDTSEHGLGTAGQKTTHDPLTVGDVMTRHVVTLSSHHSISDAVTLMAKHSFRHFLVVDTPGRLLGVVSDRDILRVLARTTNWHNTSVSQFMSQDLITVKVDTDISLAVGKMLSKRINCLPVVDDDNNVCGIITSTDLLKVFRSIQESLERQAKSGS
jgi:acetoin utilization protein AcuB